MHLKVILNRIQKQPGFVYGVFDLRQRGERLVLDIEIRAREHGRAVCSGCGQRRAGYDRLPRRRFEFIPFWGILVFFVYALRRVKCPKCGVKVERVPWAGGKSPVTTAYGWFLARWAKRLSWQEAAEVFHTSWDTVVRSVKMAVAWGQEHRDLEGIGAIGIDEISRGKGQRYVTLVYQIDAGARRLLWVGKDHTAKTLLRFFRWFGEERSGGLGFVCSDMWKAYLRVVARKAAQAVHVLDRFHIMSHMSKAIDQVRAQEAKVLKAKGKAPVLTQSRWCLLKRPENLTGKQEVKLKELLGYNLKTVRAYLLKEDFQWFWHYVSPAWAGKFLKGWCRRAMRSRIEPMKKVAKMLRVHHDLLLNWFVAKQALLSLGVVEGFNNKARVVTRRAYGFRSYELLELALYQTLGHLPEPKDAHEFF
jgi:transposase